MNNLKMRITLPEVQVEWREIAESFGFAMLSIVLYMSVILTELSFVPFMIIVIKRGWKEALVFLTIGTVLFFYMMASEIGRFPLDNELLLVSPTRYSFSFIENAVGFKGGKFLDFFFIFGCFGIVLGYFVSRNYRLNYVVFFSLAFYIVIAVFPLIVSGFIGGFKQFMAQYSRFVDIKTTGYVDLYLEQMNNYRSAMLIRGIDYNLIVKKIELAADFYKNNVIFGIAPRGGYLIKQIIIIFLGILLVKFYFKRKLNKAALSFSIKNYRIDDGWVWGLVVAWGFVYISLYLKIAVVGIVSWNVAVIFSFLFFLRGLSLIKVLADKVKIPQLLQYMVLLFFFFYSFIFFVTIVTGIGVADIWVKLRESIENIKKRSDT